MEADVGADFLDQFTCETEIEIVAHGMNPKLLSGGVACQRQPGKRLDH